MGGPSVQSASSQPVDRSCVIYYRYKNDDILCMLENEILRLADKMAAFTAN